LALVTASNTEPVRKKKKGPKGPNPLSVKKKQVARPSQDNRDIRVGEKRKREVLDTEQTELEKNDEDDMVAVSDNTTRKRRRRRKTIILDSGALSSSEISK
jgi:U3 small nucleolar RNA-associated protein 23